MSQNILHLFLLTLLFNLYLSQKEKTNIHRNLIPHPLYNTSSKNVKALKFHSKLLQTVYSDSFSKNFYYTTLYVGHNKVRQTYIIDTGSSIMSSPCSPCPDCGSHKNPYYYDINRRHKPLKCDTKICNLVSATNCMDKKTIFSKSCSFKVNRASGDGIMGYFLRDIVYFETDRKYHTMPTQRKIYRSYALPVGCTTGETGKYKELNTDGIMGMSNNPKSFISLLYNLKVINSNIFTLCFGLRGGYMSLGEVDNTFHKSEIIEYTPLLTSNVLYLVRLNSLKVADSPVSAIKTTVIASIDTGNSISYFPSIIFKNITEQFRKYCLKKEGKCGNFTYNHDLGYCADFHDRLTLFKAIYSVWPNITLHFGESEYIWKPINYYYYHFSGTQRKACLGFNYHSSDRVILGSNFIHGHDVIFDRANNRLGFVPSDCSRGNLIWNRWQGILGKTPQFEMTDPVMMDKELHDGESENQFHLGDNNNQDMVDFIQGHNTELDGKDFRTLNFIILLISIIIVAVVLVVVLSVLLCGRKKLTYEQEQAEENGEEKPNEINEVNTSDTNIQESEPNKISFEESTSNQTNLEDSK